MLNLSHETQHSCFVVSFFLIFQILSFYHFFHVWRTSFSHSLRGSLNLFYKNQSRALAISLHTVCSSFPAGTAQLKSWRQCSSNPLPLHASPQIADVEGFDVRLSNSSQKYSTPLILLPFPHLPSRKVSCNSMNTCRGMEERDYCGISAQGTPLPASWVPCPGSKQTLDPVCSRLQAGCPETSGPNLWSPQKLPYMASPCRCSKIKDFEVERSPWTIWGAPNTNTCSLLDRGRGRFCRQRRKRQRDHEAETERHGHRPQNAPECRTSPPDFQLSNR